MYVEAYSRCRRSNTLNAMYVEGVKRVHANSKNISTSVCHAVYRAEGAFGDRESALGGGGGVVFMGSASRWSASRGSCIQGACAWRGLHGGLYTGGSTSGEVYIQFGWEDPCHPPYPHPPPSLADLGKQAVRILLECFPVLKFSLNFLRHD